LVFGLRFRLIPQYSKPLLKGSVIGFQGFSCSLSAGIYENSEERKNQENGPPHIISNLGRLLLCKLQIQLKSSQYKPFRLETTSINVTSCRLKVYALRRDCRGCQSFTKIRSVF